MMFTFDRTIDKPKLISFLIFLFSTKKKKKLLYSLCTFGQIYMPSRFNDDIEDTHTHTLVEIQKETHISHTQEKNVISKNTI